VHATTITAGAKIEELIFLKEPLASGKIT